MKRKPIRVNWDDLEAAFDNPNEELVYYLDLVNGHVVLEGEGEENDFDDDEERYDLGQPATPPPADNTRAYIDRLTIEIKLGWMQRFVDESEDLDAEWLARLREATDADDPAEAVIDTLATDPEGKDRWYLFRADRLHDMIDEWLEKHEVVLIDPAPWNT